MAEEDTGMDMVLEAVADAVAQLVLFSVEAEENNSILPSIVPGAQAVQGAVNVLVDIASEMAQRYGSEPKIQQKMFESATSIRGATQQIVNDAVTLSKDQMSQQAKKSLLRSAKEVLQGTVAELHLADKYDVTKLVKSATLCKNDVHHSYAVTTADQIMDIARSLSANVVNTVKLVNQRIAILIDPILKRRLETANEITKNSIQNLVRAMGEVVKRPSDATARAEQRRISREVENALDEIIEVTRLSCKTMFQGVDLDFGLDPPARPTLQELRECHEKIVREIGNLGTAVKSNNPQDAAHALHLINSAIMQEVKLATEIADDCREDVHKINILEACDAVEKMPSELTPATKEILKRGADPSAKSRHENFSKQTIDASAAVVAAVALSSSAKDNLLAIGREMDLHLTQLDDGVDEKNKAKTAKAGKSVSDDVANATIVANAIADASKDPRAAAAIRVEVGAMNNHSPALMNSTKAAIADPNNAQVAQALHRDTATMRNIKDRLIDAATLTPEELLAKRTRELADELAKLQEAVRAGNLPEVAARLKAAKAAIADQLAIARQLAAECTDPIRKKELESAIADLERLEAQLLPISKAALSGDKAALAQLDQLLAELARVEQRLLDASRPGPEEQLKQLNAGVAENLALLADALARGDMAAARRAANNIKNDLDKEIEVLHKLEEQEADPIRKRQLAVVRNRLEQLRNEFEKTANNAIENPDHPQARAALERILRELEKEARNMDRIFPSEEERMQQLAEKIKRDLDRLQGAAQKKDPQGSSAAVKDAVTDVGQQLALATVLADKSNDPLQKKRIDEEINNVRTLSPQLVQATKNCLANPNDPKTMGALRSAINDMNAAVQALASASTMPPEQQIVEQAAAINSALNDLQKDANQGNRDATAGDNRFLANTVPRQADLLQQYADSKGDTVHKAQIEKDSAALKRLLPELQAVSTRAAADPSDQATRKQLEELIESAKALNNALLASTTSPYDQIQNTNSSVGQELQRISKAVNDRDIPETEFALKALTDAVGQEGLVVRQLAATESDPVRQRELDDAIRELESLLAQLAPLARPAASGDQRAKAQFDQTVRAMEVANNRIAQLTTKPTKELMEENASQLHRNLDQLAEALNNGDKEAAKAALGETQKGLLKQQNLVKAQAGKTNDPQQRRELLAALHDLEHTLNELPVSTRNAINNSKDVPKALQDIKFAHAAVDKSVNTGKGLDGFELLNAYNRIAQNIDAVPRSVQTNNIPARNNQIKDIKRGIDNEKAVLNDMRVDTKTKGTMNEIEGSFREFIQQAQAASSAPTSATEQKKLIDTGDKIKKQHVQLFKGALQDPAKMSNAIVDTNAALDDSLDRLQAAVRRGNRQDAVDALQDSVNHMDKHALLCSLQADAATDPKKKHEFAALAKKFTDAKQQLTTDTNNALAHPNDKAAHDKFNKTVQEVKSFNSDAVMQSHPDLEQELQKGQKAIADKMKAIMNALNAGDKVTAEKLLQELENGIKKQAILCKAMAARTTDPNKKKQFLDAAANLQNMLNQLGGPFRDLLMKQGGEKDAADFMNKLYNDIFKVNEKIEAALANEKPEEEPKDEIMQAAKHVEKVVAQKDIDPGTPEGRLYLTARNIAEEMALMSDAAQKGANSEVIVISRRIHVLVGQVGVNAKAVADMCKDPILKDQVMSLTHAINNISVQLKIITAVKAAAGTQDNSVKAQLVKCAKSLASNVVSVCNAVEIAAIRI